MTGQRAASTALGSTFIIANPVAQSGASKRVAERLKRFLQLYYHGADAFELVFTERAGHATELARGARGFDTVFALGGDGVVHEVVNGLMSLEAEARPALGVVPVGSGNDFARTLGLHDFNGEHFSRYLACARIPFDVGRIRFDAPTGEAPAHAQSHAEAHGANAPGGDSPYMQTEYFIQTFSFGLDAAIALGTFDLRARLPFSGTPLYLMSGFNVLTREFRSFPITARFDDGDPLETKVFFMAVQLGPTYGSGFHICPDADPCDGLFDVCYAGGNATRATALSVLLRAKNGNHLGSHLISLRRARRVELAFDDGAYPIQADGERIRASRAEIDLMPRALTILKPMPA